MFRAPDGARDVAVDDVLTLSGPEGHHAADVKRLQVKESLFLTDGAGAVIFGKVAAVRRGEIDVTVVSTNEFPAPALRLTVVQALAKGGRDEDAVEAMTEVGVDEIVGWQASRSVAKWTDRTLSKWQATAQAAAKQSRRFWWPTIEGPATTEMVAQRLASADVGVILHESYEDRLAAVEFPTSGSVVIVVGPEGGISNEEIDFLVWKGGGCHVVRLGDSVLRSSTAGVAALSVISAKTRWQ